MQQLQQQEETPPQSVMPTASPAATLTAKERKSRLREITRAEGVFDGEREAVLVASLLDILRDEKKPRWAERRWAAQALSRANLTPEQREEAVRLLVKVAEPQSFLMNIATKRSFLGTGSILTIFSVWAGLTYAENILQWRWWEFLLYSSAILFGISPFLMVLYLTILGYQSYRVGKVRLASLLALGEMQATEGLGVLLTASKLPNLKRKLDRTLFSLLQSLTPQHYATLSAEAVPALCELVSQEHKNLFRSEDRVLILLDALGKVGDGRALAFVAKLMQTGKTPAIQMKAREIVPILEERKRLENEYGMLLRHSQMPVDPKNDLLRAANAQSDSHPETLVRPVNSVLSADTLPE